MTRTCLCFLAALCVGGCATTETTSESFWEHPLPQEAFISGSKLPRSENMENYRGTKTFNIQDYQQYRKTRFGEM